MKIRTRLIWSFAAMLAVPLVLFLIMGGFVKSLTSAEEASPLRTMFDFDRGLKAFNLILMTKPEALLEGPALEGLLKSLPPGMTLGVYQNGRLTASTKDFLRQEHFHGMMGNRLLYSWDFRVPNLGSARLEMRARGGFWGAEAGIWILLTALGVLGILILTNGVLTWLVSRSILRPLSQLESAARKVGEGNLDPSPLPSGKDEFSRVSRSFDEMRRRLKESLESQSALEEERRTWVASMSHDIRTPLAVLKGYAEGLRDGVADTPEKQKKYVEVLIDRARLMEHLVEDLFQWARWDWGDRELRTVPLDLNQEITRAAQAWQADLPSLTVRWAPGTEVLIKADPWALRRILDNLGRNAFHHGGEAPLLEISLVITGGNIRIAFLDNGPGISPEVLPRIFDRFYRGDQARQSHRGGGGLGLTIARSLARAQGGNLDAGNGPSGGALFLLTWPLGGEE